MAGINPSDHHDSRPESSGYSNDDFEKVDATGIGFDHDGDSPSASGPGAFGYDSNQDAEISTTTDNAGEDEAEEDRYGVGASEAEAYAYNSEPIISQKEDDKFQVHFDQPSAPVPDIEPLIDFANSEAEDILSSLATSAPLSSSHNTEPIPTTRKPVQDIDDFQRESKQVERSSEETAEGGTKPDHGLSEESTSSEVHVNKQEDLSSSARTLQHRRGSQYNLEDGTWLKGVDPRESKEDKADASRHSSLLKDLIYWRDVKKTGIVFGTMLLVLLALAIFSFVSVVAYLSLAVLTVTFSFVVYKKIMGAVQKSNDGHPFKPFLDLDITLSEEKLKSVIQTVLKNTNVALKEVRRLFLVEDTVDSIKFGLLLWVLTYVGSWFNGITIIIIDLVLLFTVPKIYETYQVQIDRNIEVAKSQINKVLEIVQSKLPFLKKKEKAQ